MPVAISVIRRDFSKHILVIYWTLVVPLLFQRSFTEFKTWSINVTESQFDISTTGSNRLHLRSSSRDQPTDISNTYTRATNNCSQQFSVARRFSTTSRLDRYTGSQVRYVSLREEWDRNNLVFVALITRRECTTTTWVLFMLSALHSSDSMQCNFLQWFIQMRRDSRCGSRSIG